MITLFLIIIPSIFILTKLILHFIVYKFGKVSYEGFSALGFAYDKEKDIFYTTNDAWQRNFGYCHLYDVFAPLFMMIIDTEPVKFYYDNRNWMITFWKGQYGMTTGAEIGVYATKQKMVNKRTLYMPVDKDMLDMSFTLYKKGDKIASIKSKHWWLAIFKLGMYSKPKHLSMDISITFLDKEMLNSFLRSFKKLGYKTKHYNIVDNTLSFTYKKPHKRKVWTRMWLISFIMQHYNKRNVKWYDRYVEDIIDTDKNDSSNEKSKIFVSQMIPEILKNKSDLYKEENDEQIK